MRIKKAVTTLALVLLLLSSGSTALAQEASPSPTPSPDSSPSPSPSPSPESSPTPSPSPSPSESSDTGGTTQGEVLGDTTVLGETSREREIAKWVFGSLIALAAFVLVLKTLKSAQE